MNTTYVSTAEAKQRFSAIVNQVFYGGQQVVVTSRGKPKVAIVSLKNEDAKGTRQTEAQKEKRLKALREMDQLYKEIVKETKGKIPDPVITLRKLRRDRDKQLIANLR